MSQFFINIFQRILFSAFPYNSAHNFSEMPGNNYEMKFLGSALKPDIYHCYVMYIIPNIRDPLLSGLPRVSVFSIFQNLIR